MMLTSAKSLDRLFTYRVPPELAALAEVGSIVQIPFGKANKTQKALVVETEVSAPEQGFEIKSILNAAPEQLLREEQILLARWMKKYYAATLPSVIKLMLPPSFQVRPKKQVSYFLKADPDGAADYRDALAGQRYQKRRDLIDYFLRFKQQDFPELREQSFYSKAALEALLQDGLIGRQETALSVLAPYQKDISRSAVKKQLTAGQQRVYQAIRSDFRGVHLLRGITGSGKTEIYFELIEDVLKAGKQAIVLFPEIILTFALVRRFLERFGDAIGLFHSRLSEGEKLTEWERARNGEIKIMLGPRSALFAPLANLGIIIIDEEHESSYKSELMPKFHAVETAAKMGKIYGIPVILGSATPSVESYYYAGQGRFRLHQLEEKALTDQPVETHLIDMRQELAGGNRSFLSAELEQAISGALARREQVILLNNRRGYAKFVSCRKCGFVYQCPDCELPLTYHKEPEEMMCHHCGFSRSVQRTCPSCGSPYLKAFGMGTQKIEKELKIKYPETPVIRMDHDSTRTKHGHDLKLQEFARAESGILIGTQMIAKGLDFHNVTVVGVLAVDQGLYTDDFRAGERTFQLLTQMIGRTGRGGKPGQAFLQTYSPEHFAVRAGLCQDYEAFYREEIRYRQLLNNPPFCEILEIVVTHPALAETKRMAAALAAELKPLIAAKKWDIAMIGPAVPYIFKQAGAYREALLLKANQHKELTFLMNYLYNKRIEKMGFGLYLSINPQFFG